MGLEGGMGKTLLLLQGSYLLKFENNTAQADSESEHIGTTGSLELVVEASTEALQRHIISVAATKNSQTPNSPNDFRAP